MIDTATRIDSLTIANTTPIEEPDWSDDCECLHPKAVMEARRSLGDSPPMESIAGIFAILGDPTRMRVLIALGESELCVTDLAAATGVNRSTVSHQLRVLRGHRLVRRRREGKVVYYALDDDHVMALVRMATAHVAEDAGASGQRVSA
jgi:DNA-binding transcriptional ArsR family regulator